MSVSQHSAASIEHYTPPEIVEAAREVMGGIDLDPASCAVANEVIKARNYFDANGLARPWDIGPGAYPPRVFLNPPGGVLDPKTLEPKKAKPGKSGAGNGLASAAVWWCKLVHEYELGHVSQAVFVCFSLNVFQAAQKFDCTPPGAFPFCVPRRRLRYGGPNGVGNSPPHPSAIVYLPPRGYSRGRYVDHFEVRFSAFGHVRL